jgi:chromosome partitioning protein
MRFFALEDCLIAADGGQVRSTLNPNADRHRAAMFDSRNNLSNQVVTDVRQFAGQHFVPR